MGGSKGTEEARKRRERLESLSREEWEEAVRNFWRYFEKVNSWDEAKKTRHRLSRN